MLSRVWRPCARSGFLRSFATDIRDQAQRAREGGRVLASLDSGARAHIVSNLAELLEERSPQILGANQQDLDAAHDTLDAALIARLKLDEAKIASLSNGLRQIAADSEHTLGRVLRETKVRAHLAPPSV